MPSAAPGTAYDRPVSMGGDVRWTDTPRTYRRFEGDAGALERDLRAAVRGEVRFDSQARALYATDASNYRQVPIGVVLPRDADDLVEAVAVCHRHRAPITHRGAGTSLGGQACNEAVILDGSKYLDRIVAIDPDRRLARVQPGVRRDQLCRITEERHLLTFAPDTSTHAYATFGGMIGNNSCGMHSQRARRTQDNVAEMEILTYDGLRMRVGPTSDDELERIIRGGGRRGEIYRRLRDLRDRYADLIRERFPDIPRRVSGYNLTELLPERGFNVARALVGTEGTCVTILEATVELVHYPPKRALIVLGFEDLFKAGDHMMHIGETGATALEGMDHKLLSYMQEKSLHTEYLSALPEGRGFLLVEYGGETQEEANEKAREALDNFRAQGWDGFVDARFIEDPEQQEHLWTIRESGLGATAHLEEGETWPGWEDSAVPPERLGDYLRDLTDLYDRYGYDASLYGHFGQGCVHTRIPFDLRTTDGLLQYRRFIDEASDLCMRYGGSFSAEHGDGQARAELLPKMFGEELIEAFREFKSIWDPDGMMNPGKVVDPYRIDENLRLGVDYNPPDVETRFAYPEDDGSFAHAALRCVGVGKCRRHEMEADEVMCPSFLATGDETHTTRGRARLLFEMLNGDETPTSWHNDDVFDALELCLACKGCKNDCPVNVDMATYKAEFLSHYYEGRLRPRSAYAFGLIYWWARLASRVPRLANFFTQTPGLRTIAKKVADVAPERQVPPFAPQTFRDWFARRERPDEGRPRVLLFPDTFNNHFKPDTLKAAVGVLEAAGYGVDIPPRPLCCGRPLYDYGWIEQAKRLWRQTMETLRAEIRAETPLVVLEPSCAAAFRDELKNLFPNDWDAIRLGENVFTLGEFLRQQAPAFEVPPLRRKAVVHGHCHHKSIMGMDDEKGLLDAMGLDYELVSASCCGMAGAFGFEKEHYDVSIACGEHALLPAVREASKDTLVVADGFSCREQIQQTTDRHALHLAEVLHLALHHDDRAENGRAEAYPERRYVESMRYRKEGADAGAKRSSAGLLAASAFAAAAALTFFLNRR